MNPLYWIDLYGLAKLPGSPSELGDGWSQDNGHKHPNGEKWDHESGTSVEWHPGQAGKSGWGGKNHWHVDGGKKHFPPGTDVPDFPGDEGEGGGGDGSGQSSMSCGEDCQRSLTWTFITGIGWILLNICTLGAAGT
jgi:hypothetical protein